MATYVILPENVSGEELVLYSSTDGFAKVGLNLDVPETPSKVPKKPKSLPFRIFLCIIKGFPLIFGWIAYGIGMTGFGLGMAGGFVLIFCYYPITLISLGSYFLGEGSDCLYTSIPVLSLIGGIISGLVVIVLAVVGIKKSIDGAGGNFKNLDATRRFAICICSMYWIVAGPYSIYAFKMNEDYAKKGRANKQMCPLVYNHSPFGFFLFAIPLAFLFVIFILTVASFVFLGLAKLVGNTKAKQFFNEMATTKVPVPMPTA